MGLTNQPFVAKTLKEERTGEVFTIRINAEERKMLDHAKKLLQQPKDSTTIKQLAEIGYVVIHDSFWGKVTDIFLQNRKRNHKSGWGEVE